MRWIFIVFFLSTCLLFGLRMFFAGLQEDLRANSANEQARLFIGEEIVQSINRMETNLYKLAASTNLASFRRTQRAIAGQMEKLRHDLVVLEKGGIVRRDIQLNIEGHDAMVREVSYRSDASQSRYVMEMIEIAPQLDEIAQKTRDLETLKAAIWERQDKGDEKGFFGLHGEFDSFLKTVAPRFERLTENANRLFFDSSEKLRMLNADMEVQSLRLKQVEISLMVLVLTLATLGGWIFLRRIGQANQELASALEDMRTARDAAEKASRAKSEFVSRMSHELRTPLNAIIGFADLLNDEPLQPSQRNYVELINGSGRHLLELINAVLDRAKIEAGGLALEKIPVNLHETIAAVRIIAGEQASSRGLAFTASVSPDLPEYVLTDPTRLRQVLINILNNAIKFTEQGSVDLRVAMDEEYIVFSIRDTGIGMDTAAQARLFKPFSQADDSVTRRFGGTGLGLTISRDIVEAMGGRIEMESASGVGTVFWIWLPLQAAEKPGETEDDSPQQPGSLSELIPGTILVVDDNRVNRQLADGMLNKMGLAHDMAENGEEAVRCVETGQYALVLMDMEMPIMDGVTATRQIRDRETSAQLPRLPIIAMTANALAEDRERCFAAGMDGFVAKPIGRAALEKEFRRLFGGRSADLPQPERQTVSGLSSFDRAAALAMTGDDEDLFREIADMFLGDAPGYWNELESAFKAGDPERLARAAHTLKGLFGTFCAPAGQAAALQLEQAARAGDLVSCAERIPPVLHQLDILCAALRA